ncbi:MAG TPA: Fic family protein [Solirubrobacteraceae bacterium]
MRSYFDISARFREIPVEIVTLIGSIENSRGREQLYRAQSPRVLERLARRTRFDSITASNAIEDIILDDHRALEVVRGTTTGPYRDRPEAEFAGYRDAVDYLVGKRSEPLTVPLILHLHRLLMRHTGDPLAGELKHNDNFVGTRNRDGSRTVIFETVPAGAQTRRHMTELVERYEQALADRRVPTLPLIAALVVDFLAIHPFEEGNGRVARLLTTNELLRHDFGVAKYVSLEQRIFDSKNSYYLALRESQSHWHEGEHDLAPWTLYLLRIIQDAYRDFEQKVAADTQLIGSTKREQARNYILTQAPMRFRLAQIADALPDISSATIRDALEDLRAEGTLTVSRGRSAMWERAP